MKSIFATLLSNTTCAKVDHWSSHQTRADRVGGPQSRVLHHKVARSWVVHLSNTPLPRKWGECDRPVSTRLHLTHFLYHFLATQPRQPGEGTQITYRQQNRNLSTKEKIVIFRPIYTWNFNLIPFIWVCTYALIENIMIDNLRRVRAPNVPICVWLSTWRLSWLYNYCNNRVRINSD